MTVSLERNFASRIIPMQPHQNLKTTASLAVSPFRHISEEKIEEFLRKGYKKRHFFPHKIYYLPKCGPDGFKLAQWMCEHSDLNQLWEIVIYADNPVIDEFPKELFFDDDLIWHQQQFGKTGHIATANIVLDGSHLYSMVHISDLVQRISRSRHHKTRIENRFKGWPNMLLNSIMNFAIENNCATVYSPTSDWAMANTDPLRTVQRELFERVYDRAVCQHFLAIREGTWWACGVAGNRDRVIIPKSDHATLPTEKTICLCHDVERGFGHVEIDSSFAASADQTSPNNLQEMLRIEKELDLKATYNVLGCLFAEVREMIERHGHCVAFHSYDHKISADQLPACRRMDYRIKGYRPPQSKITPELTDENLCFHNFEWLASSAFSLGISSPIMENRIVKIPIHFDDFDLYKRKIGYEDWSQRAMDIIKENDFVAFCLHDCYADFWLPHYKEFLQNIRRLGKLKTLNEVSNEVILANSG
jgi:hypothetical protein